jgi:hypothetical protein
MPDLSPNTANLARRDLSLPMGTTTRILESKLDSANFVENAALESALSVTPTVTFSAPINSLTTYGYIVLRLSGTNAVVPSTLSFSADYRTFTITPNSPLSAATQYNLYVGGSNITDQAGYPNQTGVSTYNFTTQ